MVCRAHQFDSVYSSRADSRAMASVSPASARRLHRRLAPLLLLPLLLAALTGVAARLGRSWFGMPRSVAGALFSIHEGGFLGEPLVPFYVLAMGLGLTALLFSGARLLLAQRRSLIGGRGGQRRRRLHSRVALLAALPLLVSACTGILYRLLDSWTDLPDDRIGWLMGLHQGSWLGPELKPVYVLLVGLGLLVLLATGLAMLGPRHRPAVGAKAR